MSVLLGQLNCRKGESILNKDPATQALKDYKQGLDSNNNPYIEDSKEYDEYNVAMKLIQEGAKK